MILQGFLPALGAQGGVCEVIAGGVLAPFFSAGLLPEPSRNTVNYVSGNCGRLVGESPGLSRVLAPQGGLARVRPQKPWRLRFASSSGEGVSWLCGPLSLLIVNHQTAHHPLPM